MLHIGIQYVNKRRTGIVMGSCKESAYKAEVSWKDFLDADEALELQQAEAAKVKAVDAYNATRRLLKARCDARMRRAKESENPVQIGGDDGEKQ
jgi:nucleoid-associated protein YejK